MGTVTQMISPTKITKALNHLADFARNKSAKLDKSKITQVAQQKDDLYLSLVNFNIKEELTYTIQLVVRKDDLTHIDVICVKVTPAGVQFITDGKFKTLQAEQKGGIAEKFIEELVSCIESYA